MKIFLMASGLAIMLVSFSMNSYAETITLRSGKKIQAKVLGKAQDNSGLVIEVEGKLVSLPYSEIADIAEVHNSDDDNTVPMYEGIEKTADQKEADEKFIETIVQQAGSREAAAKGIVQNAWVYFNNGQIKDAMKRFNQAWMLDPKNPDAYSGFGSTLGQSGDYDKAITMYQKALAIDPASGHANYGMAAMYFYTKKYDLSIQYCDKAVEAAYPVAKALLDALKPYRNKK